MSELRQKVIPYEFNYLCDSCKGGMMEFTDEVDEKGGYKHKCVICSAEATLAKPYPSIQYFAEGEEPEPQE